MVTAAELLSVAAFLEDRWAQAFPSFGSERMGAPVVSFCRVGRTPVRTHEPVVAPDAVLVADATLLHAVDVFAGLRDEGFVLINSVRSPGELGLDPLVERLGADRVRTVAAGDIARRTIGKPMVNVCMLGALSGLTGVVSCDSIEHAVRERFAGEVAQRNIAALRAAFEVVSEACRA